MVWEMGGGGGVGRGGGGGEGGGGGGGEVGGGGGGGGCRRWEVMWGRWEVVQEMGGASDGKCE